MAWTERQIAMLAEMGLRVPPTAARVASVDASAALAGPVDASVAHAVPVDASVAHAVPVDASAALLAAPAVRRSDPAPVAMASPVALLGWDALRASVAGCTACALCQGRTQTVFGVGAPTAHWMVVGEAPGDAEDAQGEPFVGKPGQLLDAMLAALGLGRGTGGDGQETPSPATRVYIANAVKCRPPGNRNPAPEELATCEPYLARQVALLQPKIMLAMGRFAVQRLLRTDEPIGRLRGRVHRWQEVPLIVTYHPAYLLRNPVDKARAWDDLCLARETYDGLAA